MKVWQAGSHLTMQRGADVKDWSWAQTARRVSTLARLTAPYRARTTLAVVSLVAATLTALAPPFLAKLAIDDGISEGDLDALTVIVALFVVAGLANLLTSMAQTYFTGWTGERILADLRNKLFRHLQRLSLGYYERNRAGVVISRLTNDVEALDQLVTDGVTSLFQNTLLLVGTAIILFILDWRLALAALAVFPLMAIATSFFRARSTRAYRSVRERLGLVTATLAEDIAGMRVVQSFTRERTNHRQFRSVNDRYRDANQETVVLNGLYFPFVDFLSAVATAIVLGFGGWLTLEGEVTVGTLFAFLLYLSNFFDPVQQLSQLYNTFLSAVAALDKIMDVMDEEPEIVDSAGAEPLPQIEGDVRFDARPLRLRHRPRDPARDRPPRPRRDDRRAGRPHRGRASRRSPSCSPASTTRETARSRSTGTTCGRSRRRACAASSASCRKRGSSSPGPSTTTSPSAARMRVTRTSRPPRAPSARKSSSSIWRTATTPRSPSAAAASHSDSGSSSPSRGRSWPTRASSSWTRRRRASTSAPSGGSSSACAACWPGGRRSSSPIVSRRSGAPT